MRDFDVMQIIGVYVSGKFPFRNDVVADSTLGLVSVHIDDLLLKVIIKTLFTEHMFAFQGST